VSDPARGEALVLLSTIEIGLRKLRARLNEAGVPNLWIPKIVRRVEQIPVLATGKLDLRRCSELAAERLPAGAVAEYESRSDSPDNSPGD
jgi:acyl-[acyl-carrier-protein]-phospholipid O-acyltransferase/long-chain-fatty-acid--[acyl-carrier-protein] ligase